LRQLDKTLTTSRWSGSFVRMAILISLLLAVLSGTAFPAAPSAWEAQMRALGFRDLPHLVEVYPQAAQLRVGENVVLKLEWLRSLGIEDPVALTERSPYLLGSNLQTLRERVERLQALGIRDLVRVIEINPSILTVRPGMIESVVEWLARLGVASPIAVIERNPTFFGSDISRTLEPKVEWFIGAGVTSSARLIEKAPQLLSADVASLEEKAAWLRSIGITSLKQILDRLPITFGLSLEKIKANYVWLQTLGAPPEDLARMLTGHPSVLGYSLESLEAKRAWFVSLGVDPGRALRRWPSLFDFSPETLQLKVDWFVSLGLSPAEVGRTFANSPTLLGLNLEDNLKPSYQELHENWGMQISQLPSSAKYLGGSRERISALGRYLVSRGIDVFSLTWRIRRTLISGYSVGDFEAYLAEDDALPVKKRDVIGAVLRGGCGLRMLGGPPSSI
jgi:hypothetical protein